MAVPSCFHPFCISEGRQYKKNSFAYFLASKTQLYPPLIPCYYDCSSANKVHMTRTNQKRMFLLFSFEQLIALYSLWESSSFCLSFQFMWLSTHDFLSFLSFFNYCCHIQLSLYLYNFSPSFSLFYPIFKRLLPYSKV